MVTLKLEHLTDLTENSGLFSPSGDCLVDSFDSRILQKTLIRQEKS